MHLILCVDDKDGISFGGRRLSRDRLLCEHILHLTAGHKLWVHPDSAELFPANSVFADENYVRKAQTGDYCFCEKIETFVNIESVTLYCWNRSYPSDVKFPRRLLSGMCLVQSEDFPGNSHDRITMKRYVYEEKA